MSLVFRTLNLEHSGRCTQVSQSIGMRAVGVIDGRCHVTSQSLEYPRVLAFG